MKKIIALIIIIVAAGLYIKFVGLPEGSKKVVEEVKETVNINAIATLSDEEKNTSTSEMANTKKIRTTYSNLPVTNPTGNTFEKAKNRLKDIYNNQAQGMPRVDVYCGCKFSAGLNVDKDCAYEAQHKGNRATKIEWEHIIPAENFGQNFKEWREGNEAICKDKKGRECAKKNSEFARMEGDMYNLYPAIGEVNAIRSNFRYLELSTKDSDVETLKGCGDVAVNKKDRSFMPASPTKGELARVYLYFDAVYDNYNLSSAQKQLFTAWSNQHPISGLECKRYFLIKEAQKSDNPILKYECDKMLVEVNK